MKENDFYEECKDLEDILDRFKSRLDKLRKDYDDKKTDKETKREIERLIHIHNVKLVDIYSDNFPKDVDW